VIGLAKSFKPNKAPEVSAFKAEYIGTGTFDKTKICSGMPFLITVAAEDPEHSKLTYSLDSDQGTFDNQIDTAAGMTATFYIGSISGGDPVYVTLRVTDPKKSEFTQKIEVGSGKTGPGISLTAPAEDAITPSGSTSLTFSVSSEGSYRVYVDNSVTKAENATIGTDVTLYDDEDSAVTVPLIGPNESAAAGAVRLTSGLNRIWVVFQDTLKQTDAVGCTVLVEGDNPYIISISPADGETGASRTPAVNALFSKALNKSTVSESSIFMTAPDGSSVKGTVTYDETAFTASFTPAASLSSGATYTMTFTTAITDIIGTGNPLIQNTTFSFTTAEEGSVENPVFSLMSGTYAETQSASISAQSGASILYTLDGTVPTVTKNSDGTYKKGNGIIYDGTALSISANTTLRALAYRDNSTASGVAAASYKIRPQPPVLTFTPSDTETQRGTLAITCPSSGVTILYTTDSRDPSIYGSMLGDGQVVAITKTTFVKAVAVKKGMANSATASADLPVYTATPSLSIADTAVLTSNGRLYLTSDSGATIYYSIVSYIDDGQTTLDYEDPTATYTGPIALNGTAGEDTVYKVKAKAVKADLEESGSVTATYHVNFSSVGATRISPDGGAFDAEQLVTITCENTPGAVITWWYDGDTANAKTGISPVSIYLYRSAQINATSSLGSKETTNASCDFTLKVKTPEITASFGGTTESTAITSDQTVSISCPTPGATLHYTVTTYTNGISAGPETKDYQSVSGSGVATILIDRTKNISNVYATKGNLTQSDSMIVSGASSEATFYRKAATPVITATGTAGTGGYYFDEMEALVSCTESKPDLTYALSISSDGTANGITSANPSVTVNGTQDLAIAITKTAKISVKATKTGLMASNAAEATYVMKVATPIISSNGNYFSLSSATNGASLYYSTGLDYSSIPTTVYSSLVTVPSAGNYVAAIGKRDGWIPSGKRIEAGLDSLIGEWFGTNTASTSSLNAITLSVGSNVSTDSVTDIHGNPVSMYNLTSGSLSINSAFAGNSAFTVGFWFNFTTVPTGYTYMFNAGGSNAINYRIVHTNSNSLQIEIGASGGSTVTISKTYSASAKTWTHAAMVYTTSQIKLYINGSLSASASTSFTELSKVSSSGFGSLPGYLDGIRIYNRALTDAEISALYAEK
jgi:hypothetical protein